MSTAHSLKPCALASAIAFAVSACATTASAPPNLADARSAYDQVSVGGAANLAPDEVRAAREALEAAEAAFRREGDTASTRGKADSARQLAERAAAAIRARQARDAAPGATQ